MMPASEGVTLLPKKRFKKPRKWSFLFVDDRGRVVSFSHVRGLVLFLIVFVPVCAAATAVAVTLLANTIRENRLMDEKLALFEQRIQDLQNENESLLIALAEKKAGQVGKEDALTGAEGQGPPAAVKKDEDRKSAHGQQTSGKSPVKAPLPQKPKKSESPPKTTAARPAPVVKKTAAKPKKRIEPKVSPVTAKNVDVDNFFMTSHTEESQISVQFRLFRVAGEKKTLSGYTAVILKDAAANQENWITMPDGAMAEGGADDRELGQEFSIRNYKYVKLSAPVTVDPGQLKTASVFVFNAGGELVLEKEFPVKIQ